MDWISARAFIEAVPEGRWTSYGEVAALGGGPRGAQAVGQWVTRHDDEIDNVHRVLAKNGRVAARWVPAGKGLPAGPSAVRVLLEREGLGFNDERADPAAHFSADEWRSAPRR